MHAATHTAVVRVRVRVRVSVCACGSTDALPNPQLPKKKGCQQA